MAEMTCAVLFENRACSCSVDAAAVVVDGRETAKTTWIADWATVISLELGSSAPSGSADANAHSSASPAAPTLDVGAVARGFGGADPAPTGGSVNGDACRLTIAAMDEKGSAGVAAVGCDDGSEGPEDGASCVETVDMPGVGAGGMLRDALAAEDAGGGGGGVGESIPKDPVIAGLV